MTIQRFSPMYNFVRSRELEGTFPGGPETGAWIVTSMRIMRGWGGPDEKDWSYNGRAEDWPPVAPPGIDALAKAHRIWDYRRVRTLQDGKQAIVGKRLVIVAFDIIDQDWFNAKGGIIPMPAPGRGCNAAHAVVIVGYNDNKKLLKIANCWGTSWGDHGYGYLPYDYFNNFLSEAWILGGVAKQYPPSKINGVEEICWGGIDNGDGLHGVEFYDRRNDERIGWAFARPIDGFCDVEEFFVRPEYRGKGYGRRLCMMLRTLSQHMQSPIRLWVPHADAESRNMAAVEKVAGKLGLEIEASGVPWASYKAIASTKKLR